MTQKFNRKLQNNQYLVQTNFSPEIIDKQDLTSWERANVVLLTRYSVVISVIELHFNILFFMMTFK